MIADMTSSGMFKYTKVLPFFVSGPLGTAAVMESASCATDENNTDEIQSKAISRSRSSEKGGGSCK